MNRYCPKCNSFETIRLGWTSMFWCRSCNKKWEDAERASVELDGACPGLSEWLAPTHVLPFYSKGRMV